MCSEDLYQLSLNNRWIFTFFLFSSPKPWELIIFGVILCTFVNDACNCHLDLKKKFTYEFYILFLPVLDPGVLC